MSTIASREPLLRGAADLSKVGSSACILAEGAQHSEAQANSKVQWKLTIALILCFAFMIIEVVGGVLANSLAIMTDAAHLLSDVSGFGVSLFAAWYAARKSQSTHTFGYHRIEVLGALASVLSIWLVTGILVYEAVDRVINPVRVNGKMMFFLALAGCGVNLINLFVLEHGHSHGGQSCGGHSHSHGDDHGHSHADDHGHSGVANSHRHSDTNGHSHSHDHEHADSAHEHVHEHGHSHDEETGEAHAPHSGRDCGTHSHAGGSHAGDAAEGGHENINLRGAILHIIGDLVQSIGVAAAGALIWWKQDDPRYQLADPICTFIFALLVLFTTRLILQDISDILMERVPRHLDVDSIDTKLQRIPGVCSISDLHVWALKPSIPLLAAHVTLQPGADAGQVLARVTTACRRLGITHTTIQIDEEGHGEGCQTQLPQRVDEDAQLL